MTMMNELMTMMNERAFADIGTDIMRVLPAAAVDAEGKKTVILTFQKDHQRNRFLALIEEANRRLGGAKIG